MKIKLTDFIEQYLVSAGIHQVFMVTGGGAMHLNQSLGNSNSLRTVFNHHEQACAMGAESYYRSSNKIAVVNVTTGPGGTNAITGIYGAWTDSIGMLVISGQVKWETTVQSTDLPLRQLGDQEINIVQLVTPITKYAVTVTDPLSIKYHLDKALYLAANGRPGPVWLDIPMDVQGAVVNTNELSSFDPSELKIDQVEIDLSKVATEVVQRIAKSERPVIMVGTGIRLSQQRDNLVRLVEKLNIPVVTAWNAHDIIWTDHPLYIGRPGTIGDRAGNFAVQNADLLLILGCRLNIRQISYEWKSFARAAYKIWADIDLAELQKPTIKPDLPINCNLAHLVPQLLSNANTLSSGKHDDWIRWCKERKSRYPAYLPEYESSRPVNPYFFMNRLFEHLPDDASVVSGNGSACVISFQVARIKRHTRLYTNSGCASMGYDLPAAIGAAVAKPGKPIYCLAGDGSIMMNLQELQTIATNNLPIVIFLLNNNGYASIAQTHNSFFNGREVGSTPKSGLAFPDFADLCHGFGLKYSRIDTHNLIDQSLKEIIAEKGPHLCEVFVDPFQPFSPKLASRQVEPGVIVSSPLEDMHPFLPREELQDHLLIPEYIPNRK